MDHTRKTLRVRSDSELGTLLREAANAGESVQVDTGAEVYVLNVGRKDADIEEHDPWTQYNPDRVREGLRRSAGILSGVDRDELLADLAAQREQDDSRRPV